MAIKKRDLCYQVKLLQAANDYGTGEASAESKLFRVGEKRLKPL